MLRRIPLLVVFAAISTLSFADPGDTLVVQTYTFEEQNNPNTAYDSPGRRWFEFPEDDGTTYQKILMYHTLKCFEDGTAGGLGFPCGEWDYLTYTYLFDHTGVLDSNLLTHPQYLLNNQGFETADLISVPQYNTVQYAYDVADVVVADGAATYELSGAGAYSSAVFTTEFPRSRYQFIYTADELTAMGLTAGDIGRIELEIGADFSTADIVRIAVGSTDQTSLEQWFEGNLNEVYVNQFAPVGEGWASFQFAEPYAWDGTSSLVLQIASRNEIPQLTTTVNTEDFPGMGVGLAGDDRYIEFNNTDEIQVPAAAFADLQDEVTVALWVYGDPTIQPSNSTVFEGVNGANQRVLNSHLPWGNGRVYWDAGQSGGYDRIDKQASADEYEGQWNHYAFTKNAVSGEMKIYLNGVLWHSGADRFRTMEDIVEFSIGSSANSTNFYNGKVDEFSIWKTELDEATISEWMMRSLDDSHPMWDELLVYYDFNEENGTPILDHSGNGYNALPQGAPDRVRYAEDEIFMNVHPVDERPGIRLEQATYSITTTANTYEEQQMIAPVALSTWVVEGNNVVIEQIDYFWLPGETYLLDEEGNVLESYPITDASETVTNSTLEYYSVPFEVIDRYELGRFITPYGIGLDLEEGWTWVFDVTDYEPLLHGMVELEAGNWQELLDLKFLFIEGTPPREVKRVEAFWKGTYNLNTFDENVTDHQIQIQEGEEGFRLKTRASGHGFGTGNNCAEFCYNMHSVDVNGETQWTWQIMQECADNPLYPQGGTWIYDRAAWCPGAPVATQDLELTPFVTGLESFTVDYDIEYDPDGNYRFEGQVIAYGAPNFTTDVEIEEILAPSDFRIFSRMNPICDDPVIRIRNNGTETLTSCVITYGIGENMQSYTWTGELGFLETADVNVSYDDPTFWNGDENEVLVFEAEVSAPNGGSDGNEFNNTATSTFKRPPVYTYGEEEDDNRIVVWTKTNNAPWETTVSIETMNGTLVYYRDDFSEANFNYRDTIQLNAGCYKFILSDSGQDGLSFFANSDGNGTCRMKKVGGSTFIQFEPDFGKEIVHYFNFQTDLVAVEEEMVDEIGLTLFPNPGTERIYARLRGFAPDVQWQLFDVNGRLIREGRKVLSQDETLMIPAFDLPAGIYSVLVTDGLRRRTQRWVK